MKRKETKMEKRKNLPPFLKGNALPEIKDEVRKAEKLKKLLGQIAEKKAKKG